MADNDKWMQNVSDRVKERGTEGSFRRWLGKKEGQKVGTSDIAKGLKAKSPGIRKKAGLAKAFASARS